ncbi:MAG: hypothetical protein ACLPUO_28230 [Streptosporangiaceae bacterium]|jgi:hypothetical protein
MVEWDIFVDAVGEKRLFPRDRIGTADEPEHRRETAAGTEQAEVLAGGGNGALHCLIGTEVLDEGFAWGCGGRGIIGDRWKAGP